MTKAMLVLRATLTPYRTSSAQDTLDADAKTSIETKLKTMLAKKASLVGATFTGPVKGVAPTNDADFTNKGYVDVEDAKKLPLVGGTLSGNVELTATPTRTTHLVPKSYVDAITPDVPDDSITTAKLKDNTVTKDKMAHGTADKYLGFDGSGVPVEKDSPGGVTTFKALSDTPSTLKHDQLLRSDAFGTNITFQRIPEFYPGIQHVTKIPSVKGPALLNLLYDEYTSSGSASDVT